MPFLAGAQRTWQVAGSAPGELAWVLNLLVQTAAYAEPAVDELDATLLPGARSLRVKVGRAYRDLWDDNLGGCDELMPLAGQTGGLLEMDIEPLFSGLTSALRKPVELPLVAESPQTRRVLRRRVERLAREPQLLGRYLELLRSVWHAMDRSWNELGRDAVAEACRDWETRLQGSAPIEDLVSARHPLARLRPRAAENLLARRTLIAVCPIYFCMSGGLLTDSGGRLLVGVPADDLVPIRRQRDGAQVAAMLRVLAEPTRVTILIQLLAGPSAVMPLARRLAVPQPTVSGHLKVLKDAGLIELRRGLDGRQYVADRRRVERLLELARAMLLKWSAVKSSQ